MNKVDIRKQISRSANGAEFVTHEQIKRCFGCGNDKAYELTEGLTFFKFGRKKLYSVDDITEKVWARTEQ